MSGYLFETGDAAALGAEALFEAVERHGYAAVRGLFPKSEMRAVLGSIRAGFDASRDRPGLGDRPADVMGNYQKLVIGNGAQAGYRVPRFLRVIYNPIWAEDIYGMRAVFRRLAGLRNHIQGHRRDYAVDQVEDSLWTAARLQHYPRGGGFFMSHRDAISLTNTQEAGLSKFIQIVLLITQRGVDYEAGGTFVETAGGRVDLEAEFGAGDVILYDGRSVHGVDDVDPQELPDLRSMAGRVVALVTLYADLSRGESQHQRYRQRDYRAEDGRG